MASCYTSLPLGKQDRIIRILRIFPEPHPDDNRIQCSFITANLRDWPVYEALSYTWGEPDNCNFRVWVDGSLLRVRRNLLCALRFLRANGRFDMWIDALCIDQSNLDERNHQVTIMGRIYRGAQRVLTWLGSCSYDHFELSNTTLDIVSSPPLASEVPAFDLLDQFAARIPPSGFPFRKDDNKSRAFDFNGRQYSEALDQLVRLCFSGYWDRLWIVQEVYLARELHIIYETKIVNWKSFEVFREAFDAYKEFDFKHGGFHKQSRKRIIDSRPWALARMMAEERSVSPRLPRTLESLFYLTTDCACQDKRDKVYGIRGLISGPPNLKSIISVDYSRPILELYAAVIKLQRAQKSPIEHILGFSRLVLKTLLLPKPSEVDYSDMVSQREETLQIYNPGEEKISFECVKVGQVTRISEHPSTLFENPKREKTLPIFDEGNMSDRNTYNLISKSRVRSWTGLMHSVWQQDQDFFQQLQPPGKERPQTHDSYQLSQVPPHHQGTPGLSIFSTGNNMIGLAPKGIQEGDLLCEAKGRNFNIFTVVRPCSHVGTKSSDYSIVGRAAVSPTRAVAQETSDILLLEAYLCDEQGHRVWSTIKRDPIPVTSIATQEGVQLECSIGELHILTCPLRTVEIGSHYEKLVVARSMPRW